ncbi:MAG: CotH kinase family protein, partial [Bacteroidaceae bacterium]
MSNKKGDRYDSLAYGKQYTNVSYGRTVDGDVKSPFAYFLTASPQASNVGSASSSTWVLPPQISQSSGFYTNGFNVNISCETLDAQLFYTLDASEPTRESLPYKGTIRIDTTTVLRVCAFKDDCFCSPIVTKTYLLNERKPETLPVVFLTTAPSNLYDDSLGIYCEGKNGIVLTGGGEKANYNRSWTRLGHFEIQDWKENLFEEQSIGLSINGHASRSYDQKSFKLKAKTRYGAKRFDMPIFPQKTGYRYKTLLLRNGGQFYNVVPHLHDACLQSLADVTPLNYQVAKPSVVYLNGEYWGLYNIREAKNKDMIYSHYGLDETEFDLLEYNWRLRVNNGSKNKWLMVEDSIRAFDYTQKEACEKVKKLIDLDNYLYYMSIELLIQNTDWPANNQALFCSHRKNNKWRWILQDLDKGLETSSNLNLLETLRKSTSKLMCTKLICYILQNKEIANHYITTQSLVAGSVFRSDRFKSRLMEMKEAIAAEHSYYAARWPKQGRNPLDKTVDLMITKEATLCKYAFDNLKTNFELGAVHPLVIDTEQKAICIQFNEQRIPDLPYNGKWFEGKSLTLIAPLYHKAKKFAYWEISSGGAVRKNANTTLELLLTDSTHVTPIYEETRYARREGLYINEVSAENKTNVDKNYKYEDWIELYNSSNADIHLVGYYLSNNPANKELFQFSTTDVDATTIPANGYAIVWCSKKPERGVMHTNFKLAKLGGSLFLCKKEQGDLQLVDSLTYIEHDSKTSFGRSTDGGETFVKFDVPTFFKANLYSSYNEYVYT